MIMESLFISWTLKEIKFNCGSRKINPIKLLEDERNK
jgi:hypothetical protein